MKQTRDYLTQSEIDTLLKLARRQEGSIGYRDYCIILLMYRHGLRASELCDLQWSQVDFNNATLSVKRLKNGNPSVHPLQRDELIALRKQWNETGLNRYVFISQKKTPFARQSLNKLFLRLEDSWQKSTKSTLKLHPHMMRHTTGYLLAEKGVDTRRIQDYLGHKKIEHTVTYTQLSSGALRNIWD